MLRSLPTSFLRAFKLVVEIVMLPTYRVVALVVEVFMDKSLEAKQHLSS